MIEADLVVAGIGELATSEGRTPRLGQDLDRLRVVQDAAVACRDGHIVFAGSRHPAKGRCVWASTKPGRTVPPSASTVVAPGSGRTRVWNS